MGVIGTSILISYRTLLRNSPVINQALDATQAAMQCMEWYLGQRFINGFASSSLNCGNSTPSFCTVPTGYTVTTNVACSTYYSDSSNYKTITVTVGGLSRASLSTIIANY
jgi:hypothetical protein